MNFVISNPNHKSYEKNYNSNNFEAVIVIIVGTPNENKKIEFNINSAEDLKDFDIEQIGIEQLSSINSISVFVNSGNRNANHAIFTLKLHTFDNVQKKARVKSLCQQAIFALTE